MYAEKGDLDLMHPFRMGPLAVQVRASINVVNIAGHLESHEDDEGSPAEKCASFSATALHVLLNAWLMVGSQGHTPPSVRQIFRYTYVWPASPVCAVVSTMQHAQCSMHEEACS